MTRESDADRFAGLAERHGKPLFASLWARAWGDEYPAEMPNERVDELIAEAREVGATLDDDRAWLLVTAQRTEGVS